MSDARIVIPIENEIRALNDLRQHVWAAAILRGRRGLISSHESFGVIADFSKGLLEAVVARDLRGQRGALLEIAAACVWSIASMDAVSDAETRDAVDAIKAGAS